MCRYAIAAWVPEGGADLLEGGSYGDRVKLFSTNNKPGGRELESEYFILQHTSYDPIESALRMGQGELRSCGMVIRRAKWVQSRYSSSRIKRIVSRRDVAALRERVSHLERYYCENSPGCRVRWERVGSNGV